MGKHYNVQVHIQEVEEVDPGTGPFNAKPKPERRVTPVVEVKTSAGDLQTAVSRAQSYLAISAPAPAEAAAESDGARDAFLPLPQAANTKPR